MEMHFFIPNVTDPERSVDVERVTQSFPAKNEYDASGKGLIFLEQYWKKNKGENGMRVNASLLKGSRLVWGIKYAELEF